MNGYANYQTWNVSLWLQNDEFLYNTAKACVEFCNDNETPWEKFVRAMTHGQIGRYLVKTGDGVRWDDENIDANAINEMMLEFMDVDDDDDNRVINHQTIPCD